MNVTETVRRGTPADIQAITEIGMDSTTSARWQAADYGSIFVAERELLIAECEGKVVGFAIANDIAGEWELENIAVSREFRNRGIGQRLVWQLILEAKKSNAKFIFLEVREGNSVAKHLYERCGFQQCGRRKGYYSDPAEDAVLYRFLCSSETCE